MLLNADDKIAEHVLLFHQGNEKGLSFIFHKLYPAIVFYANQWTKSKPLAEEIASGAFVKLWKMHYKLDSFAGISAYLYKIVSRDCKRMLLAESKRGKLSRTPASEKYFAENAFNTLVTAETCRYVREGIKKLSAGSSTVIEMYYLQEKSVAEIASELNLSINTINTQKRRGIAALKKLLPKTALLLIYFLFFFSFCNISV